MSIVGQIKCKLGFHPRLDVIQTFGAAQHVGCPRCGRRFAIHHDLRAFLPWDASFAALYQLMGFDTDTALSKWQKHRRSEKNDFR